MSKGSLKGSNKMLKRFLGSHFYVNNTHFHVLVLEGKTSVTIMPRKLPPFDRVF